MNEIIVESADPVTLVGGGAASLDELEAACKLAPELVAADGGAALCARAGRAPRAIIGDMDSQPASLPEMWNPAILHPIAEQDSTDFDKALRSISAPLIIGVGFLGARLDHELAALNRLVARADKRILLLGGRDVVFLAPPRIALPLAQETRVSLFPMAPVRGASTGLVWPIDGIDMAPGGRVGTSNKARGAVALEIDRPAMLVMLPARCLTLAAEALLASAPWPARAG